MKLTIEQAAAPGFVDQVMNDSGDWGDMTIVMADGVPMTLPTRLMLLNILLWEPSFTFGLYPESADLYKEPYMKPSLINDSQSTQYAKLLRIKGAGFRDAIIDAMWMSRNRINNFAVRYLGAYVVEMNIIDLCRLWKHPKVQEIVQDVPKLEDGTDVAEAKNKQGAVQFEKLINTPFPENCLYNFVKAGALKSNQIPQTMIRYGTRAHLDDTIIRRSVNESSLSGLKSVADFGIEATAAIKATYYAQNLIQDTQYFNRRMRIACSALPKIYPGSCGRQDNYFHDVLDPMHSKQYIDKIIMVNGKRVLLTEHNVSKYAGQPIDMVSPTMCSHTDGFCEACAGRGEMNLIAYEAPNIHIGIRSSSTVNSNSSQLVLSTKHLLATRSIIYKTPPNSEKYWLRTPEAITFRPEWQRRFGRMYVSIPISDFHNPITDVSHETISSPETFTTIRSIDIIMDDTVVDRYNMVTGAVMPYLSLDFLNHMRDNLADITEADDRYVIPLAGFDSRIPFLEFAVVNDDMVAFAKNIETFFTSKITEYHSIPEALAGLRQIVYSRTSVPVFFLEVMLKVFLMESEDNPAIPVVKDPTQVLFGGLDTLCSDRFVSAKMVYERIAGSYFCDPATSLVPRGKSFYDPFFGS